MAFKICDESEKLLNSMCRLSNGLVTGTPFNWVGKIFSGGERYGDMVGDELKTCVECIAVTAKCLDGKILHHVKNRFLNLIYIKSARDREMKIFCWIGQVKYGQFVFLQVKFQSFLEILETFE